MSQSIVRSYGQAEHRLAVFPFRPRDDASHVREPLSFLLTVSTFRSSPREAVRCVSFLLADARVNVRGVRFSCRMAAMLSNCSRFAPRVIMRNNVLRAKVRLRGCSGSPESPLFASHDRLR